MPNNELIRHHVLLSLVPLPHGNLLTFEANFSLTTRNSYWNGRPVKILDSRHTDPSNEYCS